MGNSSSGRTFTKEVSINFRTRSIGIFEIVEPVIEGDEVFDSNLLKQMAESMIASGKRNITVDLSQLDYLYSDTINALIVINKRMLDVMGRLSLLGPQPPVLEILKKSGVQNILKIFINETELMRTSEDLSGMMPQAPMRAPQQPQSEFDQLRLEIGSAFEPGPAVAPMPAAPPYQAPQRPVFAPPPKQFAPPPAGPAPRYAPPPPLRPFEPAAKPPARAYAPPPPKPAAPVGAETRRMPPVPEASIPIRPLPEPAPFKADDDLDKFEAVLEKKETIPEKPRRDRFGEDDELFPPKKKSFLPVLVVLLLLVALAGGGYYYITYVYKGKEKPAPATAAVEPQKQEPSVPQLPVDTAQPATPVAATPAAEVEKKPEPAKAEVQKPEPAAKKKPIAVAPPPRPKPAAKPPRRPKPAVAEPEELEIETAVELPPIEPTPASNIEVFEETPEPPPVKPEVIASRIKPSIPPPLPPPVAVEIAQPSAAADEAATVFIASIPPVADIYMDGKLIGKTNISELKVIAGSHTLRFVKGDKEVTKQLTFQPGKNPSQMVRIP